jgi:DNA-binding MarR family transcriptional regulator
MAMESNVEKKSLAVIGKSISLLYYQRQKNMASIMARYDLGSSCYDFLANLNDREGITQQELCSILSVDRALASRTMGVLEEQGYIIRKRSPEDARSYQLYLTDKGKSIIPELFSGYDEWWKQLISDIPQEDMAILCSRLQEMAERATGNRLFVENKPATREAKYDK